MEDEIIFVDGIIVKRHERAPDYVIANLSIKCSELVDFLRKNHNDGWCNIQLKRSKGGKLYAELDTWKPSKDGLQQAPKPLPAFDDDIPF